MAKPVCTIPPEKIVLYDKLVETHPDVERKGAANPYTAVNGHMFSFLSPQTETMGLKLPPGERESFMAKYATGNITQYGIVQKEFVEVPDALLANTDELKAYFDRSFAYVSSLKPKRGTKGKR